MELNKGDTIGIIALSGECEQKKVKQAKLNFENLGFKVKLSKNIMEQNCYLAGFDEDKISELERFFEDPDIKLIIAARGGYGTIRLIGRINYEIIKNNPKPFCGYSDVTALLLMIYKKCGITTYHSPMACSDFGEKDFSLSTYENFVRTINSANFAFAGQKTYKNKSAEGILWGGNLSTVVSLCGIDFIPDKDFIFFTEDINEPVYKIDRMFQQLINIDKFKSKCKGIVLGDFLGIDDEIWLEEYFKYLAQLLCIPIISGFKITHAKEKITLPIGAKAKIDGIKLKVKL